MSESMKLMKRIFIIIFVFITVSLFAHSNRIFNPEGNSYNFEFKPLLENEILKFEKQQLFKIGPNKIKAISKTFTATQSLFKSRDEKRMIVSKILNENELLFFVDGEKGSVKYICDVSRDWNIDTKYTCDRDLNYFICSNKKDGIIYWTFDIFDLNTMKLIETRKYPDVISSSGISLYPSEREDCDFTIREGTVNFEKGRWSYSIKEKKFYEEEVDEAFNANRNFICNPEGNSYNFEFTPLLENETLKLEKLQLFKIGPAKKEKISQTFTATQVQLKSEDAKKMIVSKILKGSELLFFVDGEKGSVKYICDVDRDWDVNTEYSCDKRFNYFLCSNRKDRECYYDFSIIDLSTMKFIDTVQFPAGKFGLPYYTILSTGPSKREGYDFIISGRSVNCELGCWSYSIKDKKFYEEQIDETVREF